MLFDFYIVSYPSNGGIKQIICSNKYYNPKTYPNADGFSETSSILAQQILPDFFEQAYPIIPTLLDAYLLRYHRLYRLNRRHYHDGPVKETLRHQVKKLLMEDFLTKGLHETFTTLDISQLQHYLDEFVIEHMETIQSLSTERDLEINENLIPNGHLEPYEEAMHNSISTSKSLPRLPVNSS